jgi:polyisoprenoid-binding protein YceI
MKTATRTLTAAIALVVSASIASAAPTTWKADPKHTEVGFEVRHFFSKVHGRFREFEASIVFDEADPSAISVDATVKAASVDTGNPNRDADLKTDHFFLVEKYPTLTFKSTKVTKSGKNTYKVTGDLTMRGVTKSVTFDAEFLGSSPIGVDGESWGNKAGFEASTIVNRKDFGINWNQKLDNGGWMVDDMVKIVLSIEATAQK